MPSPDLLEAAGRRAALGPVPTPPSIDSLVAEVGRRRTKRRKVAGGAIAALVAAVAIPVGVMLVDDDQPNVVTLASDDGAELSSGDPAGVAQVEPSSSTTSVAASSSSETPSPSSTDDAVRRGPFAGLSDENFDLRLDLGDESFSIVVISGDDAAARAADAEAAADETRDIDGQAVWIARSGDEVTASAFVDGETFVEVHGPEVEIDRILDLVAEHANGPVMFFDPGMFAERFDLPEGLLDGEGFFGEGFSFDADDFPFFEDGALDEFENSMKDFTDCMEVTVDRSGSTTVVEIPDCELPDLGQLFGDGSFDDFPFDLENLFDGLDMDRSDAAID